jgi:hypothetical protein
VNDAAAAKGLLLRSGAMYYRYAMLPSMEGNDAVEDGVFRSIMSLCLALFSLYLTVCTGDEDTRFLRLCFSQPSLEQLRDVGERLASACGSIARSLSLRALDVGMGVSVQVPMWRR